jgi:hypothetical protein
VGCGVSCGRHVSEDTAPVRARSRLPGDMGHIGVESGANPL